MPDRRPIAADRAGPRPVRPRANKPFRRRRGAFSMPAVKSLSGGGTGLGQMIRQMIRTRFAPFPCTVVVPVIALLLGGCVGLAAGTGATAGVAAYQERGIEAAAIRYNPRYLQPVRRVTSSLDGHGVYKREYSGLRRKYLRVGNMRLRSA